MSGRRFDPEGREKTSGPPRRSQARLVQEVRGARSLKTAHHTWFKPCPLLPLTSPDRAEVSKSCVGSRRFISIQTGRLQRTVVRPQLSRRSSASSAWAARHKGPTPSYASTPNRSSASRALPLRIGLRSGASRAKRTYSSAGSEAGVIRAVAYRTIQ
jgi:hypothetical protein